MPVLLRLSHFTKRAAAQQGWGSVVVLVLVACSQSASSARSPSGGGACNCPEAAAISACTASSSVVTADQLLEEGSSRVGRTLSVRGTVITDVPGDAGGRCAGRALLYLLAPKKGDQAFAEAVSHLAPEGGELEPVPTCRYAVLLDEERWSCQPEACCPLEKGREVVATGVVERHECGFVLRNAEICLPSD
jgi:hypothetical protein